ncbi:MAG: hypothetical protein AAB352_01120 [Patescibacteria group bacterium]
MKKGVNLAVLETAVRAFEKAGYDVKIKNHDNDGAIMAVLGTGIREIDTLFLERLTGIKKVERDNAFFVANHSEFVEAWQFFNEKDLPALHAQAWQASKL